MERQDDGGASKQRRPEGGSVRPPSSIFGKGMTLIPTGKHLRGSFGSAALYSVFYAGAHAIWIKHEPIRGFGIRGRVNLFMRSCQVARANPARLEGFTISARFD